MAAVIEEDAKDHEEWERSQKNTQQEDSSPEAAVMRLKTEQEEAGGSEAAVGSGSSREQERGGMIRCSDDEKEHNDRDIFAPSRVCFCSDAVFPLFHLLCFICFV